jgi:tetratricopeptide (TPR) repeat protein/tRNA A-37 threonylcarbamoyl transferase component Bud32
MSSPPHPDVISHYRVLSSLGAGGMGEVYAGVDETLKRRVALKAIRAEHRLDPDAKARFLREARILSQLDHPNICRVYDYIEAEDRAWLVLELIEGETLEWGLSRGIGPDDPLRVAEQTAAVLVATHAAGIVHRDLKPGNVMITRSGDIKVLDFGLSASRPVGLTGDGDAERPTVEAAVDHDNLDETRMPSSERQRPARPIDVSHIQSVAGAIMGTVTYMSPEQARGEQATTASDMYSFGLLLQELLTKQPAYLRTSNYHEALDNARLGKTVAPTGISADLAALITRLKSLAPAQRPTAVETLERLRWIREAPRRRVRNLIVAAVAAVAILGAVKYTIDLARERTIAVQARDEADRRREQAEDLIGFMLGDLRGRLQQVGRLDLLDAVGSKAMDYFAAVPAQSLSADELHRRSQALYQLGQIRQARGDLPAALNAYRESRQLAADVAARDPGNSEWQINLATAHFYVGDALRRQADYPAAMDEFAAYRDIAQRLVDRESDNERWRLELVYARSSIAAVQEATGDLEGARRELETAQRLRQELAERAPDNRERQQAMANGHNRLGLVLERLGDTEAAMKHYTADLAIREGLVARNPADRSIKRSVGVAQSFIANLYEHRGELDAALGHLRAWRELAAAQVAADPENADWARDLGRVETRLAAVENLRGEIAEAEARYQRALTILRPIASRASTDATRQRDLASAEFGMGQILLARGNARGALAQVDAVERLLGPLAKPGEVDTARILAEARLLAGDSWQALANPAEARRHRQRAGEVLAAAASELTDTRALATRARVHLTLGQVDEARPVVERLFALGYRHPTLARAWAAARS